MSRPSELGGWLCWRSTPSHPGRRAHLYKPDYTAAAGVIGVRRVIVLFSCSGDLSFFRPFTTRSLVISGGQKASPSWTVRVRSSHEKNLSLVADVGGVPEDAVKSNT